MKRTLMFLMAAAALSFAACADNNKSELEKKADRAGEATADLAKEAGKSVENAADNTKDAMKDAAVDLRVAREEARKDIQQGFNDINAKIETMDKKMEKAAKDQKANWAKQKQKLIESRKKLSTQLDEIGDDMKAGWNEFEADFKKTLREVRENLEQ